MSFVAVSFAPGTTTAAAAGGAEESTEEARLYERHRDEINLFARTDAAMQDPALWPDYKQDRDVLPRAWGGAEWVIAPDPDLEEAGARWLSCNWMGWRAGAPAAVFHAGDFLVTYDTERITREMRQFLEEDVARVNARWRELRARFRQAVREAADARDRRFPGLRSLIARQQEAAALRHKRRRDEEEEEARAFAARERSDLAAMLDELRKMEGASAEKEKEKKAEPDVGRVD